MADFNFLDVLVLYLSLYILEAIDSTVTLKPVKEETEHMKLDDTYNAYMAYLKGDEKYLKQFGNEHNKFLAALKAMNMQHHERITKVLLVFEKFTDR